jgi:hypothetical protein
MLDAARLLHYLLSGQYLAGWRSEHAARSETGVRADGRTWGCFLLDFATALLDAAHHVARTEGMWYNSIRRRGLSLSAKPQPFLSAERTRIATLRRHHLCLRYA